MCKPSICDASTETKIEVVDKICSPMQSLLKVPLKEKSSACTIFKSSTSSSSISFQYQSSTSATEYQPSSSCSDEKKENEKNIKEAALNITRYFITTDTKTYIGLSNEWLWLIYVLHISTKCNTDDIKLTLMKIRTNDTFSRLGHQFSLSTSQASRIFKKTVKPLAHYLQSLIYCPDTNSILKNLPIPFRAYYSNICSIIDAFEIEIEKPSDPVKQALTWSEYKKCNTLKYLIVCTPDGFISFVSSGYGGRISDTILFQESNVLNIPENSGVMADRGFK